MSDEATSAGQGAGKTGLARRLGPFDATMIVMGGIIGTGIFRNPSVVAEHVPTPVLALGAWVLGGLVAMAGAFVYAELAALRPGVGGQYAYLRDAYHPMVAFLYGWTLLLVSQTGGMAGVAMGFSGYFKEVTGLGVSENVISVALLVVLTIINCFGVRAGSNVQNGFMVTKLLVLVFLIGAGWILVYPVTRTAAKPAVEFLTSPGGWAGMAAAMVPVFFSYGGWQTATFMSGELKNPGRDLARGLLFGVAGVIVVYLLVSFVCMRGLGVEKLANTKAPASDLMRLAMGDKGALLIAWGIVISTAGFLSQGMLTAPRAYYAMAKDGVFFKSVAWLHPRSHAPVVAIALQGVCAAVIAATINYGDILNFVVAIDTLFYGLTGAALFIFLMREKRARGAEPAAPRIRVPGHPWTTAMFVLFCWTLSVVTVIQFRKSAGAAFVILAAGVVVYQYWRIKKVRALRAGKVDGIGQAD